MKKIITITLLVLLMLCNSVVYTFGQQETESTIVQVGSSDLSSEIISISHKQGYILGLKGELNTENISFSVRLRNFTSSEITGKQCQWSFDNTDIARYENGEVKILKAGTTTATVTVDGVSATLLLLSKENVTDSYILYEEQFEGLPDGIMPKGWTRLEGISPSKSGVKKGAFEIDARSKPDNPVRILLPDYLNKFGNYMIEADVTCKASNDNLRWNSIMFRIQNGNYPYYQMAVRKNATLLNGVEFAERNSSNAWNVLQRDFYYEEIKDTKMYRYKVKAYDNRIQEWINNLQLIDVNVEGSYRTGGIGFQANGCVMKIDNVKITLLETPLTTVKRPEENYSRVQEANTKIAMSPSIVTEIKNQKQFEDLISKGQVATAILTINKKLEVLGEGPENVIGNVKAMYEAMKTKIIPAFRVNDPVSAMEITEYLKGNSIEDAFIVSKSPDVVKLARENYLFIRGIVEFENVTQNADASELMNIRNVTNRNLARIAIIPSEAASKSNIQYLQQRLITVWTKEPVNVEDSEQQLVTIHRMITAGANGIVTNVPEMATKALALYNHNTTIIRKPFSIGHRGAPDLAPENTIEGSELAFQLGADMVENDVRLTKRGMDGKQHLIVMHDSTINRTTNGSGRVEDKTLEELGKYLANKQFPAKYPLARIPTLNQYFEKFKGKNQVIFADIKDTNPAVVDRFVEYSKKAVVDEQLVTISPYAEQLKRAHNQIPQMSLGYVRSGYDFKFNTYWSLRYVLWQVQTLNSSIMTDYNAVDRNFIEAARHRGMNVWVWGFTDRDTIIKYFKMGVCGMTTDCPQVFSDWAAEIIPKQGSMYMKCGVTATLEADIRTYRGDVKAVEPDIVVISGGDVIGVNGNRIISKKAGTAYVMLRYTAKLSDRDGDIYDIYTRPVRIRVE